MTIAAGSTADIPVRKTIVVKAGAAHAFRVFTEGFDTWWPRSHHIGKEPMRRAILEGRIGGRLYSEHVDGTECDWGTVLDWEPPHRFVFAWQINPQWQPDPDRARASEVEVTFTPLPDGSTQVDLEHRNLQRHGEGAEALRTAVDSGWGGLLQLFAARAAQAE